MRLCLQQKITDIADVNLDVYGIGTFFSKSPTNLEQNGKCKYEIRVISKILFDFVFRSICTYWKMKKALVHPLSNTVKKKFTAGSFSILCLLVRMGWPASCNAEYVRARCES
jgi:hypothetical protein